MSLFGSLMGDFEDDPIFGHHMRSMRQMNSMMNSMFADPFGMFDMGMHQGHSALTGAHHHHQQQQQHRNAAIMPFGFSSMPNINRLMNLQIPDGATSYSSSQVVSMTHDSDGRPQVYKATSSTKTGPGGLRETQKTVQDSRTGVKKMAIGHHIISCRVGILRKLSFFLSTKTLLLLYYSLIHCHLEYLCLIWGSAANCFIRPLQVLQNRSLKFIFHLSHQHPSVELYELCKILPIKGIYCQQTCNFVKSVVCDSEYHTIEFNVIDHNHDTRFSSNLYYDTARNNFGKNKITMIGPCLFNNLPRELKDCDINKFKSNIKDWLLLKNQLSKLTKFHLPL